MPKPPSNADSIFFAALEKTDPKDRAAYLDQACGQDAKLRKRIGQLLAAQPNVAPFWRNR